MNAIELNELTTALNEVFAVTTEAPAKKAPKKSKAAPKPASEAKPEPAPKPAPVLFHGFEVKDGVDVAALNADLEAMSNAVDQISRKDTDLLPAYLAIGKSASMIAPMFKSPKLYGQFLAKVVPASSSLDPAIRSNCKWLYEAINLEGHEASDLLSVLGVNRIEDYKSGNPSVIKRNYKDAKSKAEALEKAKASGLEVEDADEAVKAMKEADKAEKEANEAKAAKAMKSAITAFVNAALKADMVTEDAAGDINSLLLSAMFDPADDTLSLLKEYTKAIKGK